MKFPIELSRTYLALSPQLYIHDANRDLVLYAFSNILKHKRSSWGFQWWHKGKQTLWHQGRLRIWFERTKDPPLHERQRKCKLNEDWSGNCLGETMTYITSAFLWHTQESTARRAVVQSEQITPKGRHRAPVSGESRLLEMVLRGPQLAPDNSF